MESYLAVALIASYAYTGGAIKLLDDIIDRELHFRGRLPICLSLSVSVTLLGGIWMAADSYSATIVLGLIVGLALAWKVNNRYFLSIALATPVVAWFLGFNPYSLLSTLPTFIVLVSTALADEGIHHASMGIGHPAIRLVLLHRPAMKIAVILLPLVELFTFIHTLAFWCFDLSYDLIGYFCARRFRDRPPPSPSFSGF